MFRDRYKKFFWVSGIILAILLFFFLWSGNICRQMIKKGELSSNIPQSVATTASAEIFSTQKAKIGPEISYKQQNLYWQGEKITFDVSDTDAKKELGLSGRTSLLPGTGMIFLFDKKDRYGFWMKDMNFSIDIVWVDDNFTVLDIKENVSPETYPQVFMPSESSKIVLELPAGFCAKKKITTGSVFKISSN